MATVHYPPINTARTSHVNLAFVFFMVSFGKGTFIFHKMQDKTKENLQSYGQTELSLGNCR
jgi:hypothetical protein